MIVVACVHVCIHACCTHVACMHAHTQTPSKYILTSEIDSFRVCEGHVDIALISSAATHDGRLFAIVITCNTFVTAAEIHISAALGLELKLGVAIEHIVTCLYQLEKEVGGRGEGGGREGGGRGEGGGLEGGRGRREGGEEGSEEGEVKGRGRGGREEEGGR